MRTQTVLPETLGLCGAGCVTLSDAIGGVYDVRHGPVVGRPMPDMLGSIGVLFLADGSVTMGRIASDTAAASFAPIIDIRPR